MTANYLREVCHMTVEPILEDMEMDKVLPRINKPVE